MVKLLINITLGNFEISLKKKRCRFNLFLLNIKHKKYQNKKIIVKFNFLFILNK